MAYRQPRGSAGLLDAEHRAGFAVLARPRPAAGSQLLRLRTGDGGDIAVAQYRWSSRRGRSLYGIAVIVCGHLSRLGLRQPAARTQQSRAADAAPQLGQAGHSTLPVPRQLAIAADHREPGLDRSAVDADTGVQLIFGTRQVSGIQRSRRHSRATAAYSASAATSTTAMAGRPRISPPSDNVLMLSKTLTNMAGARKDESA